MVNAVATATVPKFTVVIGRLVWRGKLRDVWSRVQSAHAVDVAQRADLGNGR